MLLAPLHECPHGSRPPGASGPPRVPQRRYRQGKDEPGGAPRAGGTALRAPAPSPPLSPRRPLSPSPDHPGAPTHLCARRGSSEASPPAPHRPPGEAGDGSGGRRAQQGQGEQQPPLAGGCGRQAPRCPQHRHLARAAAQGIVGRRRTRGRGGAGRGGEGLAALRGRWRVVLWPQRRSAALRATMAGPRGAAVRPIVADREGLP